MAPSSSGVFFVPLLEEGDKEDLPSSALLRPKFSVGSSLTEIKLGHRLKDMFCRWVEEESAKKAR